MTPDQLALVRNIAENPFDQLRRDIYADWLEEQGEDEEALRQRQWTPAYQRLYKVMTEPYGDPLDQEILEEIGMTSTDFFLSMIEEWATSLLQDKQIYLSFDTPEELYTDEGREQFCQDVETVSGVRISPAIRSVAGFSCAC